MTILQNKHLTSGRRGSRVVFVSMEKDTLLQTAVMASTVNQLYEQPIYLRPCHGASIP